MIKIHPNPPQRGAVYNSKYIRPHELLGLYIYFNTYQKGYPTAKCQAKSLFKLGLIIAQRPFPVS